MAQLNPQQLQAVRHQTGPLLILAGAGTGKTSVVTPRMARLIRDGVHPRHILGVTFTNKAANEMRVRLAKLVGKGTSLKDLIISTFHSLAVRIIRRDAKLLGYTTSFGICDQGEQAAMLRKAAATVKGVDGPAMDDALAAISRMKNKGMTHEQFSRSAVEEHEMALAAIYRRYQEGLRRQNMMDFDDLLHLALVLFTNHPETLEHWRDRFHFLMVDEFQDTNAVQFELVKRLAEPRNNICVVGDDDQSIYAWRGAMAGNILKFGDSFPGAVSVTLDQNYRSTTAILAAANAVIKNNAGRKEKSLWSELGQGAPVRLKVYNDQFEEAEGIAGEIRDKLAEGRRPRDFAVIVRANTQSRPLEDEFLAARLPYEVIGGQSLFDRKEAKDAMAYLAVAANPEADNQLLRIINVPARGIGDKAVDALTAAARQRHIPIAELLADPADIPDLPKNAVKAVTAFAGQVADWRRRMDGGDFAGLVQAILEQINYQDELTHLYRDPVDAAARWNQALEVGESLASFARHNPSPDGALATVADFLRETALNGRTEERKEDLDAVRIITAHSAKGLEFPVVFLPGLEEELFPHKNSIQDNGVDEERRLFYVAMTRARQELILSRNRNRVTRGKEEKREPSRFLDEIPSDLLQVHGLPTRQEEALDWLAGIKARLGG